MLSQSFFIRDTLVDKDIFNSLPNERQTKIRSLVSEFGSINYIDARTEMGPNQWRRCTGKQKSKIQDTALKAFSIEGQIKELLKSDSQLEKEEQERHSNEIKNEISRIQYRIRDIESYLQRKLQSTRSNPTKTEYSQLKERLCELQKFTL